MWVGLGGRKASSLGLMFWELQDKEAGKEAFIFFPWDVVVEMELGTGSLPAQPSLLV